MSVIVRQAIELGKILLFAARDGNIKMVLDMLDQNAPFVNDWLGYTPLHFACKNNHEKIVNILLNAGISKDCRTKVEKTPLHFAAFNGHTDIVKMLLSRGAQPNPIDMLGMSPLHWACENQHVPCVKVLLHAGADVNIVNKFGKTAFTIARDCDRADIADLIVYAAEHPTPTFKALKSTSNQNDKGGRKPIPSTKTRIYRKKRSTSPTDVNKGNLSDDAADEMLQIFRGSQDSTSTNPPKVYSRKRLATSPERLVVKKEKIYNDTPDTASPIFQDCDSLSPDEADRQATLRFLETHGIKMLPKDDYTIVASAVESGQSVSLTEAGKMALKAVEMHSLSVPPSTTDKPVPAIENSKPSPEKSKKSQSPQLVHVNNSFNLADNNLEGKRIIKIRAEQLIDMKKRNKVLIRPFSNTRSPSKIVDHATELKEAFNAFKMEETTNSLNFDESDFDEVLKQLCASQSLIKLYRQQLINKEKELKLYKQLLLKKSNELRRLQQAQLSNSM